MNRKPWRELVAPYEDVRRSTVQQVEFAAITTEGNDRSRSSAAGVGSIMGTHSDAVGTGAGGN